MQEGDDILYQKPRMEMQVRLYFKRGRSSDKVWSVLGKEVWWKV